MAENQNSEITNVIVKSLKLASAIDAIPKSVVNNIQPVLEVKPKISTICKWADANNSASAFVLYTIPSNVDFYFTGGVLSLNKDAGATSATTNLCGYINNELVILLTIRGITSVSQSQTISISPTVPLKLDSGSTVFVAHATAAANVSARAVVYGYEEANQ